MLRLPRTSETESSPPANPGASAGDYHCFSHGITSPAFAHELMPHTDARLLTPVP